MRVIVSEACVALRDRLSVPSPSGSARELSGCDQHVASLGRPALLLSYYGSSPTWGTRALGQSGRVRVQLREEVSLGRGTYEKVTREGRRDGRHRRHREACFSVVWSLALRI